MLKSTATLALIAALAAPLPGHATSPATGSFLNLDLPGPELVKDDKDKKKKKRKSKKRERDDDDDRGARRKRGGDDDDRDEARGQRRGGDDDDDDDDYDDNGRRAARATEKAEKAEKADDGDRRLTIDPAVALGALAAAPLVWDHARVRSLIDCPPGLAKKTVPCVPPGLANKGMTAQDWLANTPEVRDRPTEEYRGWVNDRRKSLDGVPLVEQDWFLRQEEIMRIFDLDPAPAGFNYAVIDGQAVLLNDEDYDLLRRVPRLTEVQIPAPETPFPLDVLMTQDQMIRTFDLPPAPEGSFYTIVDGRILRLPQEQYEMLQLVRFLSLVG